MTSYVECYNNDYDVIKRIYSPCDEHVDCYFITFNGRNLENIKLSGRCNRFALENIHDLNMLNTDNLKDLEIIEYFIADNDKHLLKLLELKIKIVWSFSDEKITKIINKYLQEEPDPSMRDIQGCKYELAINGFGDKL